MAVHTNQATPPIVLHQSFSLRLAKAKKAAIEAALKQRHECLRTADLKLHSVSNTELLSNLEAVSNSEDVAITKDTEGISEHVPTAEVVSSAEPVLSAQVLNHQSNATGQPTDVKDETDTKITDTPFNLTKHYSQLKSVRKRKRPINIKKTDTRFSPSTSSSTSPMEPSTSHPVTARIVQTRTTRHISSWYDSIDTKSKYSRGDLETIRYFIRLRKQCEKAVTENTAQDIERLFSELRARLHQMEFYDFLSGVLISKSRILEDEGLPAIFDGSVGVYPWDIRADCRMLYQKWAVGQLDPHLFRGIEDKKITKSDGKIVKSRKFASDSDKKSPNYVGEGNLVNGMWWPLQFCAMRDGAHGETEAGIHGQIGHGAYSIVVSNGGYDNVDEGNRLKYCGTSGSLGEPSHGTKLMNESFVTKSPIRVLRSASLPQSNPFRPAKGLRYDGLYEITGFEILDAGTAMHRFSLKRQDGQDPIRYQGVEARPTSEELVGYAKIRKLLGFSS